MFTTIFTFIIKWKLLNPWIIIAPFFIDLIVIFAIIDTIHNIFKYKYKIISFKQYNEEIIDNAKIDEIKEKVLKCLKSEEDK